VGSSNIRPPPPGSTWQEVSGIEFHFLEVLAAVDVNRLGLKVPGYGTISAYW